jgi:hypothetical protein
MSWIRYRFHTDQNDYRPVKWPAVGPYWCTGYAADSAVVVAYLPKDANLKEFWPDASRIDEEPRAELTFTERFPKPSWWN